MGGFLESFPKYQLVIVWLDKVSSFDEKFEQLLCWIITQGNESLYNGDDASSLKSIRVRQCIVI